MERSTPWRCSPPPTLTEKLYMGVHGIPVELSSPARDEYLCHNEA
jgi:hypothetical protein